MRHRGDFTDIFEALKVFPKGIADDDIVTISGKIYKWSKRRCTFVTDGVHVPQPGDNHPVITLFTSLTADGVLTDFMGNKWQLAAWGDRVAVPTITVQDVTTDSEYGYPSLVGKYEAVYLVTLEHEDSEAEVWYKIIKDGSEPETFSKYYEPFIIRENGVYQIVAKARKAGTEESVVAQSDRFKVTRVVTSETYSNIIVTEFRYDDVPYVGGTAKPHLAYQQTGSRVYTDGTTESITPVTSGATLLFTRLAGIDALTGDFPVLRNDWKARNNLGVVTVQITLNGKTTTKTTTVYQQGNTNKPVNKLKWVNGKNPTAQQYPQGTLLTIGTDFEAYTNDGAEITYYTYEGTQKVEIIDSITVTKSMVIGATSAETMMYDESTIEAQVFVRGIPDIYYGFGISQSNLTTIVDSGDGSSLVRPGAHYPFGEIYAPGNVNESIENGGIQDAVLWIAISSSINVDINTVQVLINQGGFSVSINQWLECDATFKENNVIYSVYYTPLENNAILASINYKK